MSNSLALYDAQKMDSVSKDIIAQYSAERLHDEILAWAREYDTPLADAVAADPRYSQRVFALNGAMIGQTQRKDLACWSDVRRAYGFFFDALYRASAASGSNMPAVAAEDLRAILKGCVESLGTMRDKDAWVADLRAFGESIGYTTDRKAYKQDPARFKGVFGDLMMILRVALTNQQQTPDLYDIVQIMGVERAVERLESGVEIR
jgi:glutamyl-tRNA synthetase